MKHQPTREQETTLCPFCGTTQKVNNTYTEQVIAYHKDGDKPCKGWGKSVEKAEELFAAVAELLEVIAQKLEKQS